ncbi:MAG: excinuclease ABC subunit UvrC [Clostridia bacterium]|nr:excinuclease ABC subunit UvrC [Clostridia bacterium]
MNSALEEKLKMLPEDPGVYVMLDADGKIIYVGKAKVLKNRVRQYFHSDKKPEKVAAMVANISDLYYIITKSEIDALSLENNLIKKHKPRYNILLKDDKTYPYIRVDLKEKFPCFTVTRKIRRDGAKYYGPFMGGVNAKDTLEIVNGAFGLRPCAIRIDGEKVRKVCLNYHIKKCPAPCAAMISEKDYGERVAAGMDFLSGDDDGVEKILKEKMEKFAALEEFEIALSYRERLKMLEKIKLKRITALNKFVDIDVIAVATNGVFSAANMLFTRGGRMQGAKNFAFEDASMTNEERLYGFIMQYYASEAEIPDEIIVSEKLSDSDAVADYFKKTFSKSVRIYRAERGIGRQLSEMAVKNAEDFLEKEVDRIKHREDMTVKACEKLKEVLYLKKYPRRMECYDISHVSGVDKVGSMAVFIDGEPDKTQYRRFRIKTVEGSDDFACLKEVLRRRMDKLGTDEEEKFPLPDLIVIDGGKGQLSSVAEVLAEYPYDIDVASIAKQNEEIFVTRSPEPIVLPRRDYTLRTIQRIRDEAHRFAITYHRQTHVKRNLESLLTGIEGVGKVGRRALMDKFGSIENIKRAPVEEIAATHGIGIKRAKAVKEFLNNDKDGNK